jgi:hypothetical protein
MFRESHGAAIIPVVLILLASFLFVTPISTVAQPVGTAPWLRVAVSSGIVAGWTNVTANVTGALPMVAPEGYSGTTSGQMVFDPMENATLIFGMVGQWPGPKAYAETEIYRHGQWVNLTNAGGPTTTNVAMAYDSVLGGIALLDGDNHTLWLFQCGNWTLLNTTGSSLSNDSYIMAYDAQEGDLVVSNAPDVGSANFTSCPGGGLCVATSSVWRLNSSLVWSPAVPLPEAPCEYGSNIEQLVRPEMAYDTSGDDVVAINDAGWVYTYAGNNWTNTSSSLSGLGYEYDVYSLLTGESLAFDPQLGGVVLFGGACVAGGTSDTCGYTSTNSAGQWVEGWNSTWIFRQGNWTNISTPSDPSPRANVAMAYDPADNYLLAYGGNGALFDPNQDYGTPADPTVGTETWVLNNQSVTVDPIRDLVAIATPNPTDVGVPVTLNVTFAGGAAPFTYAWSSGSTNRTTSVTYALAGNFSVTVEVTDQQGTYEVATVEVVVNSPPAAGIMFQPKETAGVAEQFTANATNGTPPYLYQWSFGNGANRSGANVSYAYPYAGSYTLNQTSTDSLGETDVVHGFVVVASQIGVNFTVSNSTPSLGQSVWFNASVNGGIGPFTFAWAGLPPGCVSQDQPTIGCLPTESGTYNVSVNVSDDYLGVTEASVNVAVIFAFTFSVSSPTPSVGQSITFSVRTTASELAFSYSGLPPGCESEDSATLTCVPTASGEFSVAAIVSDRAGDSSARSVFLHVLPATPTSMPGSGPPGANPPTTGNSIAVPVWALFAGLCLTLVSGIGIGLLWSRRSTRGRVTRPKDVR